MITFKKYVILHRVTEISSASILIIKIETIYIELICSSKIYHIFKQLLQAQIHENPL